MKRPYFKIGDKVLIKRKIEFNNDEIQWVRSMDRYVGKVGVITRVVKTSTYSYCTVFVSPSAILKSWNFPHKSLRKVSFV